MAWNDKIGGFSQYGESTFESESKMLERLAELQRKLTDSTYNYEEELRKNKQAKRLQDLEKEFNFNIKVKEKEAKLEEKYNKILASKKSKLSAAEYAEFEKKLKKKSDKELREYKALLKKKEDAEKAQALVAQRHTAREDLLNGKKDIRARINQARELVNEQGFGALADSLIAGISDLARQLDSQIDEIASYQSKIDARLQGSGKKWEGGFMGFNKGLSQTIAGMFGISPFFTQQKMVDNLNKLVEKGIAYNVEQRAFLETISDKIATTFDAANGTLLQLVRVQQADTSAARLGMEAYLTRYLNSMYQTTEYLSDISKTVSQSLYEATSILGGAEGVAFEYQVQKWLGSLYSVGMSSGGVQSIANALGYLGSGNISGLAGNSTMQNLLVMAASRSGGKSYAQLLKDGLDESETNKLMKAMVEYLAEIADSNNNVIKAQYASIFGMSMSDLKSIKNILPSVIDISKNALDYGGAIQELYNQANQVASRTSIGEMLSNMWTNTKYSMSAGIASNPALYGIWKIANLLTDTVGGIAIPAVSVMGSMVDLETTVADIMRVGALSGGILSSLGAIISGGGGGINLPSTLKSLGISTNTLSTISRGEGLGTLKSGVTVSQRAVVGNSSGSDIEAGVNAGAEDTKHKAAVKAEEENTETKLSTVDEHILNIYNLFNDIISNGSLQVKVTDYGLVTGGSYN